MNKFYIFIALVVLVMTTYVSYTLSQISTLNTADTNEAATIAEIFKKGLQTNQANNPNLSDADTFGAALISLAWNKFADCPDAAPQMCAAFEQYVTEKSSKEQYSLWDIFLENLEGALLKCRDAKHLQANWLIRQKALEKQTTALKMWADATSKELDLYIQAIFKLEKLADIKPLTPDLQEAVEFLLGDIDTAEFGKTELRNKAASIAKMIDSKLVDIVKKIEKDVVTEKQRDLNGIITPVLDETVTKDNDKVWQKGRYQELLENISPIVNLRENPAVIFWTAYRIDENNSIPFIDQLGKTYQDATRLQRVRYNLWALGTLSAPDVNIDRIVYINSDLLELSVRELYLKKESELITKQPDNRASDIRKILLRNKVPLSAF